ncbi:Lrp/AsnC family transcriptional regulator [Cryobacterium sp. TMT1-2-2]|jgi:Lrp/AsnC family leucine-responsive transcriptional regulator|uniref:Lrp/AsnC family transcriptional regulator n=1 Tax=unclassified Cryobacterium TaxID=2649013 RepID=UPI000CE47787|nr:MULTISPECIES: Lrp/AsnC family transcriptional regulator [unclassified Cryobacterium]TFD13309.1 Lrp/AsnC family transcriptional regulator [Cryobacterium sp. TMT1-2-2]
MTAISSFGLDKVDTDILSALQADGRQTIAQLSRVLNMSNSAVAERVRRLEESGVISGYSAVVDASRLGFTIMAYLRLRYPSSIYEPLHTLLAEIPEVIEAHHVTGEDCFIMKVVATSMQHLEQVSGRIGTLGSVTTSVVYSSPLQPRPLLPPTSKPTK